ncbi:MAG: HD domain-containing phosphohydrolase [Gemmatimonadaceae bacterium]
MSRDDAVAEAASLAASRSAADTSREVAASEVLAALSRALDLTEGQPLGHSVRACVIGMRLGRDAGLGDEELAQLYYALLLKDSGCSSNAARIASIFGSDDQAVKPRMKIVDWDDRMRLAVATWHSSGMRDSLWSRLRYFLGIVRQERMTRDIIEARCERGADIARRLGFANGTVQAIRSLDEHWNGQGYPGGTRGDEIPVMSRILNLAQTVEVFQGTEGPDATTSMLRHRRGRWFDPRLTDLVLTWVHDEPFWEMVQSPDVESHVKTLEPAHWVRRVDEHCLDQIAQAFADIIDAKSPFTYRHSSQVAMYACAIGEGLGFDAATMIRTRRAGLLHDVGKVGVSNRILDKPGPLGPEERAAVERHPLYTWEILRRVAVFRDFARQAATHHEKLDGSGYPWNLDGGELDVPSRALAVADIYEALTADRPYREGMPVEGALSILEREKGARLDADAVDALAAAVTRAAHDEVL